MTLLVKETELLYINQLNLYQKFIDLIMMTTVESLPAFPLSDYIRCYSLREIDTGGQDLPRPLIPQMRVKPIIDGWSFLNFKSVMF
nr:hypothetical protein [Pedobacter panaciterrae]